MSKTKEPALGQREMMIIAAEASVDVRTVRRAYAGEELKTLTKERIVKAAEKLKMKAPPETKDK